MLWGAAFPHPHFKGQVSSTASAMQGPALLCPLHKDQPLLLCPQGTEPALPNAATIKRWDQFSHTQPTMTSSIVLPRGDSGPRSQVLQLMRDRSEPALCNPQASTWLQATARPGKSSWPLGATWAADRGPRPLLLQSWMLTWSLVAAQAGHHYGLRWHYRLLTSGCLFLTILMSSGLPLFIVSKLFRFCFFPSHFSTKYVVIIMDAALPMWQWVGKGVLQCLPPHQHHVNVTSHFHLFICSFLVSLFWKGLTV